MINFLFYVPVGHLDVVYREVSSNSGGYFFVAMLSSLSSLYVFVLNSFHMYDILIFSQIQWNDSSLLLKFLLPCSKFRLFVYLIQSHFKSFLLLFLLVLESSPQRYY